MDISKIIQLKPSELKIGDIIIVHRRHLADTIGLVVSFTNSHNPRVRMFNPNSTTKETLFYSGKDKAVQLLQYQTHFTVIYRNYEQ